MKQTITIKYDTLQSHSGVLFFSDDNKKEYFSSLEIIGNNLVVFESDNGCTDKGRLNSTYSLDENVITTKKY